MAQWHDAGVGFCNAWSIVMAATHGTAAQCGCWLLHHFVSHEGWHTQHGRHGGTMRVLAS